MMAAMNTLVWLGPYSVYGYSSSGLVWSLVDYIPWCSYCKLTLAVSMLGGKCLVTIFSSRSGNVVSKTCLMPLRSTFYFGFTNELWLYRTRYVLVTFFITILLAWCMLGRDVGNKSTWMSHKQFCKFLVPVKFHWPYLLNYLTSVSLKATVHP